MSTRFNTLMLFFSVLIFDLNAQTELFSVIAVKRYSTISLEGDTFRIVPDSNIYYKITMLGHDNINHDYKEQPKIFSSIDTIKAIEELLAFQGDNRICVNSVTNYNLKARDAIRAVSVDSTNYTLQLEALFLINQLVFEHPFHYSATPVLKYAFNRYKSSMDENLLALAYEGYRRWFKRVQIEGLRAVLKRGYRPLDDTNVRWY